MRLLADVFLNLQTPKNIMRKISKKSHFRGPFDKSHGKWEERLFEAEGQQVYHIY